MENKQGSKQDRGKETIWAVCLCLIVVALIIISTSAAPLWIYQGF